MKPQSTTKLTWIRAQIVLAIAILTSLIVAPSASAVTGNAEPEGTWLVRVRVNDAPPGFPVPFDALETYSRGGGIVTSNNNPLIPRPGQGAWTKTGSDEYTASITFFFFDPIGAPIGTVEGTHRFTIQDDRYRGTGEARFKDLNGDPLFPEHPGPFTFTTRARRVTAAAAAAAQSAETYVGRLEGLNDVIGIDITQSDAKNRRIVRAYLCDGEPGGDARWYSGVMTGNRVRLGSIDGETSLEVKVGHDAITGFVILADGSVRRFTATTATGGAGIYEIEVTADGVMRGVSLAGDVLLATKSSERVTKFADGRPWDITVTTSGGQSFHYLKYDLTSMSIDVLKRLGLPTIYSTAGVASAQPDAYTAVLIAAEDLSTPGPEWLLFGRNGNVRLGAAGIRIIAVEGIPEPA